MEIILRVDIHGDYRAYARAEKIVETNSATGKSAAANKISAGNPDIHSRTGDAIKAHEFVVICICQRGNGIINNAICGAGELQPGIVCNNPELIYRAGSAERFIIETIGAYDGIYVHAVGVHLGIYRVIDNLIATIFNTIAVGIVVEENRQCAAEIISNRGGGGILRGGAVIQYLFYRICAGQVVVVENIGMAL